MAERQRSLSVLIHGASKSGKSTLAASAPAPRLFADVESASRFLPIRAYSWTNPKAERPPVVDGTWDTCVVPTRDWATIEVLYQWLASGDHPFNSFIIDSISELQNRYIESVAGRRQLTQPQWGDAYRAVGGLVRDIRDLTMHPTRPMECIVMTAMTRQIEDKWRPWCQGQLQTLLPYLVDSVVYIFLDEEVNDLTGEGHEVRRILTRMTDEIEAGERVGGSWPRIITDPNINDMIGLIFGPKKALEAAAT
jgi:hypothetical protein